MTILNMKIENNYKMKRQPIVSYFGLFDGHGGHTVSDELKDNLHNYIINDQIFENPVNSILDGFNNIEKNILDKLCNTTQQIDTGGSCALIAILIGKLSYHIDNLCCIANLGDSRGIISLNLANKIHTLSTDHRPDSGIEKHRIITNGGSIFLDTRENFKLVKRILPGVLSVSRTIGDIEAKIPRFRGQPGVIIAVPDILSFNIHSEIDFIILASI